MQKNLYSRLARLEIVKTPSWDNVSEKELVRALCLIRHQLSGNTISPDEESEIDVILAKTPPLINHNKEALIAMSDEEIDQKVNEEIVRIGNLLGL